LLFCCSGPGEFTEALEQRTLRRLTPGKAERPRKPLGQEDQTK
jgi:hypothetical protein